MITYKYFCRIQYRAQLTNKMASISSFLWYLVILSTVCYETIRSDDNNPVIQVSQGAVKGQKVNSSVADPYYSFLGIPYAKPPVGNLRFKAPVAPDSWNGTLEALTVGNNCLQTGSGDEDCLYLNVMTPQLPGSNSLLPVMVWIHGGGFRTGSGNPKNGNPEFLLKEGIVVVRINYRLGALGFLNTQDEAIPGNAGMKDQVMALRWVQENIAAFGGDPEKVTIMGESAGSVSVSLQMLSPMSKGLFRAAIAESGSAANLVHIRRNPRSDAFYLGNLLGYSGNSSTELVEFLLTQSAADILKAQGTLPKADRYRFLSIVYGPSAESVVEGEEIFLTDNPISLYDQGQFHDVPFLTGTCTTEGMSFITGVIRGTRPPEKVEQDFSKIFKPDLRYCQDSECGDEMIIKIKEFYFGNESVSNSTLQNLADLATDMYFAEGTVFSIDKITAQNTAPVYFYSFAYEGNLNNAKRNNPGASFISGTAHGDELGYIFQYHADSRANATDLLVRSEIISLWTNFIKTLNPTPEATDNIPTWLSYTPSVTNFLDIDSTLLVETDYRKERMDFWKNLYISYSSST